MYETNVLAHVNAADRKMLLSSVTSQKLSHAYLFIGEDTHRSESSCVEFLGMIMKNDDADITVQRIKNHTHSDVMNIYPDGATVKIKQLRNIVSEFLQAAPTEAEYRAVIIHEAEKMTDEAQNFLLKTIEEPPKGAMILLIADSVEPLLGTILSRVTKISVAKNEDKLQNQQIRDFVSNRMSKLILEGHIEGIFSTAKALMNSADENGKNISQKDAALVNLEYVYAFFVQMLMYNKTKQTKQYKKEDFGILAGKIGHLCNLNIIDIIEDTIIRISHNASPQLALESMLIRILEECNAENSWNKI